MYLELRRDEMLFFGQEKLYFDVPNDFPFYHYDLQRKELIISRRLADIGWIMIWQESY